MLYPFKCHECDVATAIDTKPLCPPPPPACSECGEKMSRVFGCQIDTSGCKDHDFIPEKARVASNDGFGIGKRAADRKAVKFQKHIQERRKLLRDGGNRGSIRQTHAIPADLFHGKIRETGDRHYWDDKKNMKRHKSTEVG